MRGLLACALLCAVTAIGCALPPLGPSPIPKAELERRIARELTGWVGRVRSVNCPRDLTGAPIGGMTCDLTTVNGTAWVAYVHVLSVQDGRIAYNAYTLHTVTLPPAAQGGAGRPVIERARMEVGLLRRLTSRLEAGMLRAVTCPGDLAAERGESTACVLHYADGVDRKAQVTVRGGSGAAGRGAGVPVEVMLG